MKRNALTVSCTMEDGRPLQVLSGLIAKRRKYLGESTKDAVVATAIDALRSIRATTSVATARSASRDSRSIRIEDTGWYGSFDREHKTCIRSGTRFNSPKVEKDIRYRWLCRGEKKQERRHVYKVHPVHSRPDKPDNGAYYVVATSPAEAANHEKSRAYERIKNFGKLARNAVSVAMYKLSTRNPAPTGKAKNVAAASKLAKVTRMESAGVYSVCFEDSLAYSLEAIKGGTQAVNVAIMKAANKIAGRLQQAAKRKGMDVEEVGTPFPEVKRK